MNFKYFKIILSFGFAVMNGVLAMENSSDDAQSFSHSLPPLTFESAQQDYKQFLGTQDPALKIKMISNLNELLMQGKIDAQNKSAALEITKGLEAGNLENSINFYQVDISNLGPFAVLPQEMFSEIIKHLGQGPDRLKEAIKLLTVNKSFCSVVISSPIDIGFFTNDIDSSSHKDKITNDVIFKIIQLFPNARSMDLRFCSKITDTVLSYLPGLKNLTFLNLTNNINITDSGINNLPGLKNLSYLTLRHCTSITNKGFNNLSGLTKLTFLHLTSNNITASDFNNLSGLKNLSYLNLGYCTKITDKDLTNLSGLTKLTYLNLSYCWNITDRGLTKLSGLAKLTYLDLSYCKQITNEGLAWILEHMLNLKEINAVNINVTQPRLIDELKIRFPHVIIQSN